MAQITVDIDENEFKKMSREQLKQFIEQAVKEKMRKIERIREIAAKSKATDKDVEELTEKANKAMIKHYSKYYEK